MDRTERNNSFKSVTSSQDSQILSNINNGPSNVRKSFKKDFGTFGKRKKAPNDSNDAKFMALTHGLEYNCKFIGCIIVNELRGKAVCQEALQNLKLKIKSDNAHKQKIIFKISLNGISIFDAKNKILLHKHPVNRISFVSKDTKDNRCFGYIVSLEDKSIKYFGYKSEKPAEIVVTAIHDLFMIIKEIKSRTSGNGASVFNTSNNSNPISNNTNNSNLLLNSTFDILNSSSRTSSVLGCEIQTPVSTKSGIVATQLNTLIQNTDLLSISDPFSPISSTTAPSAQIDPFVLNPSFLNIEPTKNGSTASNNITESHQPQHHNITSLAWNENIIENQRPTNYVLSNDWPSIHNGVNMNTPNKLLFTENNNFNHNTEKWDAFSSNTVNFTNDTNLFPPYNDNSDRGKRLEKPNFDLEFDPFALHDQKIEYPNSASYRQQNNNNLSNYNNAITDVVNIIGDMGFDMCSPPPPMLPPPPPPSVITQREEGNFAMCNGIAVLSTKPPPIPPRPHHATHLPQIDNNINGDDCNINLSQEPHSINSWLFKDISTHLMNTNTNENINFNITNPSNFNEKTVNSVNYTTSFTNDSKSSCNHNMKKENNDSIKICLPQKTQKKPGQIIGHQDNISVSSMSSLGSYDASLAPTTIVKNADTIKAAKTKSEALSSSCSTSSIPSSVEANLE